LGDDGGGNSGGQPPNPGTWGPGPTNGNCVPGANDPFSWIDGFFGADGNVGDNPAPSAGGPCGLPSTGGGGGGRNCTTGTPGCFNVPQTPCSSAGNAPSPTFYTGQALQGNPDNPEQDTSLPNLTTALSFNILGSLNAQKQGASPAYANYVYGAYMSAAGWSLPDSLNFANIYAFWFSSYTNNPPMDPSYPSTPAANVTNITNGYNAQQNGTLCSTALPAH
jgi:hypothetical protein